MNKIAILLPVFKNDSSGYLQQAIKSLNNQTFDEFDLIILVDGFIADELLIIITNTPTVNSIILKFPINRGLPSVLNEGIKYCLEHGYEYIGRMDADDVSLPERIDKQITFLINNPKVDVVGGAIEEIDENSNLRGHKIVYPITHNDCFLFFKKRDPLAHPSVMFRISYFIKAGLYNEKYIKNQDTILWFEGFNRGCVFANIPETILNYRMNNSFFTSRRGGFQRAKMMLVYRFRIVKVLKYGITGYAYAIGMFLITISPTKIRKLAYKLLR